MKNNIYKIKEKYDNLKENELMKTGIFYAFSDKQWEENRTYKETSTNKNYLRVGTCGAYIHEKDKEKLDNYFFKVCKELNKKMVEEIGIDDLIEYELINHECYFTGDYYEIVPLISDYLNADKSQDNDILEQIEIVYRKTKKIMNGRREKRWTLKNGIKL